MRGPSYLCGHVFYKLNLKHGGAHREKHLVVNYYFLKRYNNVCKNGLIIAVKL